MSRIGKQPVPIPSGVEAKVENATIKIKGPKGELTQDFDADFNVEIEDAQILVKRPSDRPSHLAKHGLYRALIANMVTGVSQGFERKLEIEGVGYSAKSEGPKKITLNIGFCHPVIIEAPEGIELETPSANAILVKGADKQQVGQLAANIRKVRPPEPYKGKGIRYSGEYVRRKAGKAVGGK